MNKEFVPYQESFELKELGFDEECLASYYIAGKKLDIVWYVRHGEYTILAPLYQQAFRWFREKHNLNGFVLPFGEGLFDYRIYSNKQGEHLFGSPEFKSYEEAELACLRKLIEIVKSKS